MHDVPSLVRALSCSHILSSLDLLEDNAVWRYCALNSSHLRDGTLSNRQMTDHTLYITGAGVSAESGIPTFRGTDGLWTVGSENYTPQEMATRQMYLSHPDEFLLWYFKRFASHRHVKPNTVHHWLADKRLVTQNIDGLDGKAGNAAYEPIHGPLDQVTVLHDRINFVRLKLW